MGVHVEYRAVFQYACMHLTALVAADSWNMAPESFGLEKAPMESIMSCDEAVVTVRTASTRRFVTAGVRGAVPGGGRGKNCVECLVEFFVRADELFL